MASSQASKLHIVQTLESLPDVCFVFPTSNNQKLFAFSSVLRECSAVWNASLSGEWNDTSNVAILNAGSGCSETDEPTASSVLNGKLESKAEAPPTSKSEMHMIIIRAYSYDVVRAALYWLLTGHIELEGADNSTHRPYAELLGPVDPWDLYLFAHFYDITELMTVALQGLKSGFRANTITWQLFGSRAEQYPQLKEAILEYVKKCWETVKQEPTFREKVKRVCEGETDSYASIIIADLFVWANKL